MKILGRSQAESLIQDIETFQRRLQHVARDLEHASTTVGWPPDAEGRAGLGHASNIARLDPDVAHREVVEVVSQKHGAVGPGCAGN